MGIGGIRAAIQSQEVRDGAGQGSAPLLHQTAAGRRTFSSKFWSNERPVKDGRQWLLFIGNGAVNCLNLLLEIFELNARRKVGAIGRRITPVLNQAVAKGPEIIQWGRRAAADVCHSLNSIPVSWRRSDIGRDLGSWYSHG
jgi:hypothetical protein